MAGSKTTRYLLVLAGSLLILCNLAILYSVSYFKLEECQVYIDEYGRDWVSGMWCDYMFQPIVESPVSYLSIIGLPVIAGSFFIIYALTQCNAIEVKGIFSSFSGLVTFGLLTFISLAPIAFFVISESWVNQYFLETRNCSPDALRSMDEEMRLSQEEFCPVVTGIYNAGQREVFTNLGLSVVWMIPLAICFWKARTFSGFVHISP